MYFTIIIITCKLKLSRHNSKTCAIRYCHNPLYAGLHYRNVRQYWSGYVVTHSNPVYHGQVSSVCMHLDFPYVTNTMPLMQVSCLLRCITGTWPASSPAPPGVGYPCSWCSIPLSAGDTAAMCSARHSSCISHGEYTYCCVFKSPCFLGATRDFEIELWQHSSPKFVFFFHEHKTFYYLRFVEMG